MASSREMRMTRRRWLGSAAAGALALLARPRFARADEIEPEYRLAIDRGLAWLVRRQFADGHWEAQGGHYPMAMTGLSGMALLLEGSTLHNGKFANQVRKAVDWFMERSQANGLLARPDNPMEAARYIYGHGYGMLFLSQVYGEEDDGDRRRKLHDILVRAVQFSGKAATPAGGWGYVSSTDSSGFDEGSTTVTQLQALRACRNAGIPVPKEIIDKAQDYLRKCTAADGGIMYKINQGGPGSPALTAAGLAGGFSIGEYNSPHVKKWLQFCRSRIPLAAGGDRLGHDEYTHYYYAQALHTLGEHGDAKLFPDIKDADRLTWSKYRKVKFQQLVRAQSADGSWNPVGTWGNHVGIVYCTAVNLTILQLDAGTVPFYQT